jgi:hypothetical protein
MCPRNATTMIMCTARTAFHQRCWLAGRNLRNEKASLTTTLITKLLTNPLAQSQSTAYSGVQSPPQGRSTTQDRLSMASNKVGKDRSMTTQAQRHRARDSAIRDGNVR